MEYPIQEDLVIDIRDNVYGDEKIVAQVVVKPMCAYDVFTLSKEFDDNNKTRKRAEDFLRENLEVIYHKPSKRYNKLAYYAIYPISRAKYRLRVLKRLRFVAYDVSEYIFKEIFKKHVSIFSGIQYPKLKWQKWSNRWTTFLEALMMLSKSIACDPKKILKTYTFYEIMTLIDAMQLINNESIPEYQSVNLQAVSKTKKIVSKSKEIKNSIKQFKEKRRLFKERKAKKESLNK